MSSTLEEPRLAPQNESSIRPAPANPKLFVIALRCGRLGNRLLIFAHFMALAEEQGHRLINVTFHSYADMFEVPRRDIYCQYPVPQHRSVFEVLPGAAPAIRKTRIFYHVIRNGCRLHDRLRIFGKSAVVLHESHRRDYVTPLEGPEVQEKIHEAKLVFVYGWRFHAPALVERHAAKIRAYFRPIEEYEMASRQAVESLRQQADVVVGVHIRLGDNYKWRGGRYYFPVSRYIGWMKELAEQFPGRKVAFLVCSDEPRRVDEFPGLSVGLGPGSPLGDMNALAKCDYIFGPYSTFTQWASFYGDKPLYLLYSLKDPIRLKKFQVNYLDLPTSDFLDGESPHARS